MHAGDRERGRPGVGLPMAIASSSANPKRVCGRSSPSSGARRSATCAVAPAARAAAGQLVAFVGVVDDDRGAGRDAARSAAPRGFTAAVMMTPLPGTPRSSTCASSRSLGESTPEAEPRAASTNASALFALRAK